MIVTSKDFELKPSKWMENVPGAERDTWAVHFKFSDICHHCGKPLQLPFVYWHLCNSGLCLHLPCAVNLGEKLKVDGARIPPTS